MASTGKIACLPLHIREELNHRLAAGEPGRLILPWLNSLPGVQTILSGSFHHSPINHQNLSHWRRGAFKEWQHRQYFLAGLREITADSDAMESVLGQSLTEHAARLLALHFTRVLCPTEVVRGQPLAAPALNTREIKSLCEMSLAVARLRRGDRNSSPKAHQSTGRISPSSVPFSRNPHAAPRSPASAFKPFQANSTPKTAPIPAKSPQFHPDT